MKTRKTWLIVLAAITALTVAVSSINAEKKAAQPASNAFGQSFDEWMRDYIAWAWVPGSGASGPMSQNNVLFMPIPNPGPDDWDSDYEGSGRLIGIAEMDLTLKPGTKCVLPALGWIGETYVDGSEDIPWPEEWFLPPDAEVNIMLDGAPLVNAANQADFYYGPIAFQETLWYPEPTGYGSTGAIWVQGIGVIIPPMSAGKHTLTLYSWDEHFGVGWFNTWHITVQSPGKK